MELTTSIREYVEKRINSLEKFINYHDEIQVWVEVGKITEHHKSGEIFRAEVQIRLPNESLRAESKKNDLYAAIDDVHDEISREIKKLKTKLSSKERRGARMLKKLVSVFYK